jgi:prophage regulatory protein
MISQKLLRNIAYKNKLFERSMSMRIIKLHDVKKITTFSISTIYRLASQGKFPKPIKLAERSSGWIEHEVLDYLDNRIAQREDVQLVTEPIESEDKG